MIPDPVQELRDKAITLGTREAPEEWVTLVDAEAAVAAGRDEGRAEALRAVTSEAVVSAAEAARTGNRMRVSMPGPSAHYDMIYALRAAAEAAAAVLDEKEPTDGCR